MDELTGLGTFGVILALFWALAGLLLPFLVWGIYNQTHRSARELERLRKLMELQTAAPCIQNNTNQPADTDPARDM